MADMPMPMALVTGVGVYVNAPVGYGTRGSEKRPSGREGSEGKERSRPTRGSVNAVRSGPAGKQKMCLDRCWDLFSGKFSLKYILIYSNCCLGETILFIIQEFESLNLLFKTKLHCKKKLLV